MERENKMYRIEVCANSAMSAVKAREGGADRVELCAGIPEGGTTPSYGEILTARRLLDATRLHVIIRPRGGDFLYTLLEREIMLRDIAAAREIGADGVVFGCLTAQGDVDVPLMKRLIEAAGGMSVTFHRAFDVCRDPMESLERIIELGIDRILTSGQAPKAEQGTPLLRELVERADGRVIIMPGCGVNPSNIRRIAQETGAREFHFSGRRAVESGMAFRNPRVSMGGTVTVGEYTRDETDPALVRAAFHALGIIDRNLLKKP